MNCHQPSATKTGATFPNDPTGLDACTGPRIVELADGDSFEMRIAPVAMTIGTRPVRMLSYDGSIPGPTLRVRQGSEITVHVRNDADLATTVHWHGLRLDNAYDGVPEDTQDPIAVGGEFSYRLKFPDAGLYWYHPHVREDYALDLGLYGNVVVDPVDVGYWPQVNREEVVTVDDILMENGTVAPYNVDGPTFVAMGRFGNVMLTAGQESPVLYANAGDVVRYHFTNTANTRLFNVAIAGARMKLIGGDSGRYEHETFVDAVLLSPSERAIVDVFFERPGTYDLESRTPGHTYVLGRVDVAPVPSDSSYLVQFEQLRTSEEMADERRRLEADRARPADKTLAFDSLMPLLYSGPDTVADAWTCPMHPEVIRNAPDICPLCGMKLIPLEAGASAMAGHDMPHDMAHDHGAADGLEWEDLMPEINRASDEHNMTWKLVDRETGAENGAIDWTFAVGDRIKIRLENGMDQDHPMHHPFHIHGAGRFLVMSRDGEPVDNLVWKDTVLVRSNETVEILLDVSNPGLWMAHCHIAEHNQSGMMFSFRVAPKDAS